MYYKRPEKTRYLRYGSVPLSNSSQEFVMAIPKWHKKHILYKAYPISDLIKEYVSLKLKIKKSTNDKEWIGLCPFHADTTPSFTVTNRKQFFHCFGCGKNGGLVDFLIEFKGLDYQGALLEIAMHYKVKIPNGKTAKKKLKDRKRRLRVVRRENKKLDTASRLGRESLDLFEDALPSSRDRKGKYGKVSGK